ncbi:hypothetical protein GCM10018793_08300 [Streptomyces sulfonofaciens]|uniref:Integral membrane protein n=1 Tax=Streptomyces sulfonofaciens TaxID=68272 RepID=A0A919KTH5_9ACTN|nr:hypothetical protein [Streptomyces sulfonofaciens]GHH71994.1 hypothetical protein GCM10018793_08300 [Streptomyces sulfonofaciens]
MADSAPVPAPPLRAEPLQRLLFAGVYGTVLASATASALGHESGPADPGYDALWVLLTALAAAAAHGFAHALAHRTAHGGTATLSTVRSVVQEWPLLAAVVPTLAALAGSYWGWWSENGGIDAALGINTAALFGWGLWSARLADRNWFASCRAGAVDMLLGLLIVLANALSK